MIPCSAAIICLDVLSSLRLNRVQGNLRSLVHARIGLSDNSFAAPHFDFMALGGKGGLSRRDPRSESNGRAAAESSGSDSENSFERQPGVFLSFMPLRTTCRAHIHGQLQRSADCSAEVISMGMLKVKGLLFSYRKVEYIHSSHESCIIHIAVEIRQIICGCPVGGLFVNKAARQSPACCPVACGCFLRHFSCSSCNSSIHLCLTAFAFARADTPGPVRVKTSPSMLSGLSLSEDEPESSLC